MLTQLLLQLRLKRTSVLAMLILAACAPSHQATTVIVENRCATDIWVRLDDRPNLTAAEMSGRPTYLVRAQAKTQVSDAFVHLDDGREGTVAVSALRDAAGRTASLPPDEDTVVIASVQGEICP